MMPPLLLMIRLPPPLLLKALHFVGFRTRKAAFAPEPAGADDTVDQEPYIEAAETDGTTDEALPPGTIPAGEPPSPPADELLPGEPVSD